MGEKTEVKNLRPYQVIAFNSIIEHMRSSSDPVVADLCVGFGKTVLIAHIARHVINKGGNVLSLAHTRELVSGAAKTFGENCGIFCASLKKKT